MQQGAFAQQNVISKLESGQGTVIKATAHDLLRC